MSAHASRSLSDDDSQVPLSIEHRVESFGQIPILFKVLERLFSMYIRSSPSLDRVECRSSSWSLATAGVCVRERPGEGGVSEGIKGWEAGRRAEEGDLHETYSLLRLVCIKQSM